MNNNWRLWLLILLAIAGYSEANEAEEDKRWPIAREFCAKATPAQMATLLALNGNHNGSCMEGVINYWYNKTIVLEDREHDLDLSPLCLYEGVNDIKIVAEHKLSHLDCIARHELKYFWLWNRFYDGDLSFLANQTNLKDLVLSVKSHDWSPLSRLSKLPRLYLSSHDPDANLSVINQLTNLKDLDIEGSTMATLPDLSRLQQVEHLTIFDNHNLVDINGIGQMKALKKLWIANNLQLQRMANLSGLDALEEMDLTYSYFTDMSGIAGAPSLKHIKLDHGYKPIPAQNLIDAILAAPVLETVSTWQLDIPGLNEQQILRLAQHPTFIAMGLTDSIGYHDNTPLFDAAQRHIMVSSWDHNLSCSARNYEDYLNGQRCNAKQHQCGEYPHFLWDLCVWWYKD